MGSIPADILALRNMTLQKRADNVQNNIRLNEIHNKPKPESTPIPLLMPMPMHMRMLMDTPMLMPMMIPKAAPVDITNNMADILHKKSSITKNNQITTASMETDKAKIESYKALIESHKGNIYSYKATIKQANEKIEEYKAKIEPYKVYAESYRSRIEPYTPKREPSKAIVDFYNTGIGAYKDTRSPSMTHGGYVSARLVGGIGNRIFQILAALGYSEKFQKICIISKTHILNGSNSHEKDLDDMISIIFPGVNFIDNIQNYAIINELEHFTYNPLENYSVNVLLNGYFQNEKYFPSTPAIPVLKTASYANTYFIHIRAGDYIGHPTFNHDMTLYYNNCISMIGPNVKYIVFSNDNKYARNYMKKFNIDYTLSEETNQLKILIEMANCEGGICANSSFSWVGAFFQDKALGKRFMPSKWANGSNCSGVYPTWATVVNCLSEIPHSVCISLSGGLGNRIFQIFAGLAYAKRYGKKFVLCKSLYQTPEKSHESNTDSMIEFIFPDIEYISSLTDYSVVQEKFHMSYNELEYYNGNVLLKGYFQVERYSLELERIPNIRTAYYENTYFIHIRLGDYIGFFGMDFDLSNYHRKCINILGPHVKYIIFSNENDKAEKYIKQFNINYTISDKTDALETLIEMANCAGGICANSTFSWMGAFFQREPRRNVFVPAKWVPNRIVTGIFPSWATRIEV